MAKLNQKKKKNKNRLARDKRKKNYENDYHNHSLSIHTLSSAEPQNIEDSEDSEEPIVITELPGSAHIPELYQNLANNLQRSIMVVRGNLKKEVAK